MPEPTIVCYYCQRCNGPMGPLDTVAGVYFGGRQVGIRHADESLCDRVKKFLDQHQRNLSADAIGFYEQRSPK